MAFPFRRSRANSRSGSPGVEEEEENSHIDNYLRELTSPVAANVDIVAIHGLNPGKAQHGELTWSKNGVLWLQDEKFLPGRFPNARVLLFSYNSRVATGTSNAGVMDIAKVLLNRLRIKRRDDPNRPIVFLCHSLGGIIVKQALVRAVHGTAYESIRRSTKGIAFFGTPHRGGNLADLGSILAKIALLTTGNVKNNFMETLQKNSTGAADIHELFKEQAQEYQIVSFYETLQLVPPFGLIVDKVSATLGLPDSVEISVPVAANHSEICKFDRRDQTYELVIENLADLIQHALKPPRMGTPLLAPTISLIDPENRYKSISVASFQSTEGFYLSDSGGSSSRSSYQYGMPTFQDTQPDYSHQSAGIDSTPTSPVIILPYSSNPEFIGRDKIFDKVKESLSLTTSGQRRIALYGLGGVGKSQITIRYAYWYRQNFPDHSIFWIHCGTADRFRQGLIDIGNACHVSGISDRGNNRLLLLKDWLQRKTDFKWLMILDNADDPSIFRDSTDLAEPGQVDLSSYIPDCEHGSILITTRDLKVGRRLANGRAPIQINKMSRQEALMMLKTKLSTRGETSSPITPATPASYQQPVSDTDLLRLAHSLDYLPLAMVQATGFIMENSISINRYMQLFKDDASAVTLLKHNVEESGRDSDIPSSVYATWKLSIEQIQQEYPKSAELIFLMAHYEQLQIPASLLKHYVGHNAVEFTTIIGVLLRFSLIVGGRDATYNMHRLVQLIVKQWLAASGAAPEWQSRALHLLSTHFPNGEFETWAVCAPLEPHAVKIIHTPGYKDADKPFLGTLQLNLAWYYSNRGTWASAEEYARAACITLQEAHSLKHRATLAAKKKFANILKQNSKLEEAELVIKQTVDEIKSLLGTKNEQYFDALDLFALIAQTRGRLAVAEKASRKSLAGQEKVLGPHHPSVFRSQRRLATILEFQGRYDEAEVCIMSALNGQKHLIGTADKTTLKVMQRLVFIQRALGKYDEAEKTAEEYLRITAATYGPKHIDTHEARYTLATSLSLNSKIDEADKILLSLVEFIDKEHPFGPDHQYNFFIQNALADIRMVQGRYEEASKLMSTAFEGIQKTYGKRHAKTYEYQSRYAAALTAAANASESDGAFTMQQQAYDGLKTVVGEEHPSTLTALLHLSEAHAAKRDLSRAVKLAEQVLKGRENKLSVNHPDILAARKWVVEVRAMNQGTTTATTTGANSNLETLENGNSDKKQKKRRSFFGLRSRASSTSTPLQPTDISPTDDHSAKNKKPSPQEELEKTESNDSSKGKRKSSLGLFGRFLTGDIDDKDNDKEIELSMDSDSDDEEAKRDVEKSAAFTFTGPPNRLSPLPPLPILPPRPAAVPSQSDTIAQHSDSQHAPRTEIPNLPVQQEDSAAPQIRRKPIALKASSEQDQEGRQYEVSKSEEVSELPVDMIVNPASRLDGPGWDDSPYGA